MGKRMGLSLVETGRMTLRMFFRFYQHYKDTFDMELSLELSRMTYSQAENKEVQDEEWF